MTFFIQKYIFLFRSSTYFCPKTTKYVSIIKLPETILRFSIFISIFWLFSKYFSTFLLKRVITLLFAISVRFFFFLKLFWQKSKMSFLLRSLTSLPKRQLTLPKKQLMVYQQLRGAKMRAQHLEVGPKRRLAYRQVPGQKKPTIVMVPGLHSYLHMQGMTARALLRYFLGGF